MKGSDWLGLTPVSIQGQRVVLGPPSQILSCRGITAFMEHQPDLIPPTVSPALGPGQLPLVFAVSDDGPDNEHSFPSSLLDSQEARAPCHPERSLLLKLPLPLQIAFLNSGRVNPKQIKPNPQKYLQPLTVLVTSVTIQCCVRKHPKLNDLKQQSLVFMDLSLNLVD